MMKIGVLALQGAFREHVEVLKELNVKPVLVRRSSKDLEDVDGLIIPGGESTAMGIIGKVAFELRLNRFQAHMKENGLLDALKTFTSTKPTWGTCAGMVLLANKALHQKEGGQSLLGGMDITVDRNYFGSQIKSFETEIMIPELDTSTPFHLVFIRAPVIVETGSKVDKVLAQLSEREIIAAQQQQIWHKYFLSIVQKHKNQESHS